MIRVFLTSLILFIFNSVVITSAITLDDVEVEGGFAEVVSTYGEVLIKKNKGDEWQKIEPSQELNEFSAIKTSPQSYMKLILKDNSIVQISEKTAFTVEYNKGFNFNLAYGKLRILSVREGKKVMTPWGEGILKNGEYIWDVHQVNKKLKVEITAISGELILDGEKIKPEAYDLPPEKKPYSAYSYDYPYLLYFGEKAEDRFKSYDLEFKPHFPSRAIASESEIEVFIEEKKTADQFFDSEPVFKPVKGEIWVHDIAYDEAVRIIEKKTAEIARELLPTALKTASDNLVWEVASRSVFKWGVYYAKNISKYQVPIAVKGSFLGKRKPASSYYEKDHYKDSTEQIAAVRSYRAAKVAVLKKGYEKGWEEAQKYAQMMLPKIITPIISEKIYDTVKPQAMKAVRKAVENSKLVFTKDVERLIDHLSQIAATKECERWIEKVGPKYASLAAQKAAKEAARGAAEDIAFHMSQESKKRAGKLMGDLLARERARKVAREVAGEAQEEKAASFKRRSKRYFIESQR